MIWRNCTKGELPTKDQQVVIEVNNCCYLADYDDKQKIFKALTTHELVFDPVFHAIRWAPLERATQL
jgi:hypothetical protein